MKTLRIPTWTYPLLLGFASAYLAAGVIAWKIGPSAPVVPAASTSGGSDRPQVNTEAIIEKNVFDIQTGVPAPAEEQTAETKPEVSVGNLSLAGLLEGNPVSYALVKQGAEVMLLKQGVPRKGMELLSVESPKATLTVNGRQVTLVLPDSDRPDFASGGGAPTGTPANQPAAKVTLPGGNTERPAPTEGENLKASIPRETIAGELSDINEVIKSVLITPYYRSGEFMGYRVSRMAPTNVLAKVGLQNGDIIIRINGQELNSPEVLFDLLSRIGDLNAITIDVLRANRKQTIFVEIT